jgi:hypothetical protein
MWTTILKVFFLRNSFEFLLIVSVCFKIGLVFIISNKKNQTNSTGIVFQVGYLTPLTLPCIFHREWRQKINKRMNGVLLSKQNPRMF